MNPNTKRTIFRWTHIIFGLSLVAYIYGPPEETRRYLPYFRYGYMPVVLVTGLWMWKGQALARLVSRNDRSASGIKREQS